jgi:hypothetical protein
MTFATDPKVRWFMLLQETKFRCECCGGIFPYWSNKTLYEGFYYCYDCAGMWFNG